MPKSSQTILIVDDEPVNLAGDAIPLSAWIMAQANTFNVIISRRVCKSAMSFDAARDIIASERNRHFDPDIVDAFLESFDEFVQIAYRYRTESYTIHQNLSSYGS